MADNDDFERQLELEKQEQEKKTQGDPYTYVDPNDGTAYIWDKEKNAWFPKVDESLILNYYSQYDNYNKDEAASSTTQSGETSKTEDNKLKRKANEEPGWFEVDDAHNTNVYVSGLPSDITEDEFIELMSKCGIIMKDDSGQFKLKLYQNADGSYKGDARCCYIKVESVNLALNILDGFRVRNSVIHVERAQFQMKGEKYDATKKPKKRKPKEKEKMKKKMEKLFDWRPEKLRGMRSRNESTAILKNMFEPSEFEEDPRLILDYQKDIREECTKCGEVKKVVIYDRNPEGIVAVTFAEPEMADECIALMNGRWFAQRQLTAETWDGRTKYKVVETEEELEKRLNKWDEFLEGDEKPSAKNEHPSQSSTAGSSSIEPSKNPAKTDESDQVSSST